MKRQQLNAIIKHLRSLGDPKNVEGMARFGIVTKKAYGVSAPALHAIAKEIGTNHTLAQQLWSTGIHDARGLAALIDDPSLVTTEQMESWVKDFDNWAICDCCCTYLFRRTPFAWKKARAWTKRKEEFVKRAGFTLMATSAVHDKAADDRAFSALLPIIKREVDDDRNGVKKAVNWALRQIGKRNPSLNKQAIQTAKDIQKSESRSAKWIAADALRELTSEAVQTRLRKKKYHAMK